MQINQNLKMAPKGTLKLQKQRGKLYYYQQFKNDTNGLYMKKYISKKEKTIIYQLAQKGYDMQVKQRIEKELQILQQLKRIYEHENVNEVYASLSDARKELINHARLGNIEQIRKWKNETYAPCNKYPETQIYETENGEMVRSKSEVIIANLLFRHKEDLLYKYERPLEVIINRKKCTIYPDFTIINIHTGQMTYWEHAGRMDDESYVSKFVRKVNTYIGNNLIPGKNVFITYETANCPLDIRIVKKLIDKLIYVSL